MSKGILMEKEQMHWVVMTSDGEFVKIPPQGQGSVRLGEEVHFTPEEKPGFFTSFMRYPWVTGGLAAAILVFALLVPLFKPMDVNAQTYVYIDINTHTAVGSANRGHSLNQKNANSSLEVGVNGEGEVISVDGINPPGEYMARMVRENLEYEGTHIDEFVADFLNQAKEKKWLHPKDEIIVSQVTESDQEVSSSKEEKNHNTLDKIKKKVDTDPKLRGAHLEMVTLPLPDRLKDRAKKLEVSPARYALWLFANSEGHELTRDELQDQTVNELLELLKDALDPDDPPTEKQWNQWMTAYDPVKQRDPERPKDQTDSNPKEEPSDTIKKPEDQSTDTSGDSQDAGGDPSGQEPSNDPPPSDGTTSGGDTEGDDSNPEPTNPDPEGSTGDSQASGDSSSETKEPDKVPALDSGGSEY
ncbi:anti-sigma factor-like protein [Melghirimyces profundicolus]|uniref:Anti-sigma factor-like protein n=1 Tax=Melghirimyces profundicolus TaxID=1242148 RepID=A0A2T6C7C8_9BACL|nr:anti-sigma factor domain-containing protein [Melghirimyces profundicolus]PTX64229.1 anti-sigma factor-like protein [Melghirimyces profundicolus]